MKTDILRVPGATLYYEVRGSGPVLLLICGGVYDAAGYAGLAGQLADRYTVVTYDRRGNSRSPLDGPPEPQRIEVHGDEESAGEPPYRAAFAIAEGLGTKPVPFPGDHGGFGIDTAAFGRKLHDVLKES